MKYSHSRATVDLAMIVKTSVVKKIDGCGSCNALGKPELITEGGG